MTNIQIYSDLHCEFGYKTAPEDCLADIVICAGDFSNKLEHIKLLRSWHKDSSIVYIAGNHEFYGTENMYDRYLKIQKECIDNDIYFLQNCYVIVKDCLIIGATLWTNFDLYNNAEKDKHSFRRLNDGRYIKYFNDKYMNSDHCLAEFNTSIKYIEDTIKVFSKDNLKPIIVTHHGVSNKSVHSKYKIGNSVASLNGCFSSNLDNFILKHQPNLWVHGHTHDSFDYFIGNTRVVVNPKGYEDYFGNIENKSFNKQLVVKI